MAPKNTSEKPAVTSKVLGGFLKMEELICLRSDS